MAPVTPPAQAGNAGSSAAQAFKEELARQPGGDIPHAPQAPIARPPTIPGAEGRVNNRKKVSGRVRLQLNGVGEFAGKILDISDAGIRLLLDDAIPAKRICSLSCDVFNAGLNTRFSLSAVSVYSVLASGQGFKVGFQFGPLDAATSKAIQGVLSS